MRCSRFQHHAQKPPLGHIETKDIGTNLDEMERGKGANGEQFKRYLTLPNWILTDYLEFRWFVGGEKRMTASVGEIDAKGKLKPLSDGEENLTQLLNAFFKQKAHRRHGQRACATHGGHDSHHP